jgi:hypothetical protein
MLVGNRCLRCIALSLPFPTAASLSTQSRPRPFSTSPNNYDPQSHNYGQNSVSLLPQSQHSAPPNDSGNLRMALDSLADAVLMLSHIISQLTAERQLLLNRKSGLFQKYKRIVEKEKKLVLLSEVNSVNASIEAVENKLLYARESRIPVSYYVRLKRLHGNLPYPKPRRPNRKDDQSTLIRRSHSTLIGLLSLPGSNVLHELAHFLVTTSLPITETSFLVMIQKLSVLRFGSAARSAYHSLIAAGYSPTSPRAISLMLKLMPAIRDRTEFFRLQTLLDRSNISHDAYIYTQLIVGNLKMGSPTGALQQFRAMIASRFQPTLQALTALLHDCGSRRNWQLGIEVWRSLGLGQTNLRFRIDLWAYQEMWRLCRKCGQQTSARQILRAAKKDGFKVDDLIHTRGRKTKSLAIRATNKAPQLRDLKNSLKEPPLKIDDFTRQVIRDAVLTPSRSRQTLIPPLESSLKSSSTLSEIPSSQYRQAVEKMMLAKYRKSSPTISSSWMEESNTAIPLSHDRRSPTYCQGRDWDENLSDILREAAETFLSEWSVLSTTGGQTLKSRLWFKYGQTSPRSRPPSPTPLDLAKHLSRSHRSSNQHPRTSLPLSKAHKKPLATSHVGRGEARDKTNMVYTAAWTGASRCGARGKEKPEDC